MMAKKNKLCAILNLTENDNALKPLTNNRPIAALPFAGRYRIIDFLLSDLAEADADSVALFIGESGRSIYDHIRSGSDWGLESAVGGGIFTFSQQNWKKQHIDENEHEDFYYNHRLYLKRSHAEYVFVAGSKVIANVNIDAVQKQHAKNGLDVTVIYKNISADDAIHNEPKEKAVLIDQNPVRLVDYSQAEAKEGRLNASLGMYLLTVEKLEEIIDRAGQDQLYMGLDEVVLHYILQGDLEVDPYEYTGYVANIANMENYYEANLEMNNRAKFTSLFYSSIPILTKTKHGAPTYYGADSQVTQAIVATDVRIDGQVTNSVINRKVTVAANAVVKDSVILQGTKIGEGARVEYAIIDKDSVIEAGAQVIGSPDNIVVLSKNSVIKA